MNFIVGFMTKWTRRSIGCSDVVQWLFAEKLIY
jgi:hypothetical protein